MHTLLISIALACATPPAAQKAAPATEIKVPADDAQDLKTVQAMAKEMVSSLEAKDYKKFLKNYCLLSPKVTEEQIERIAAGFQAEKIALMIPFLKDIENAKYSFEEGTKDRTLVYVAEFRKNKKVKFVKVDGAWKIKLL